MLADLLFYYRIMRPDDANIVGNVHGGIILKMIEEAGCIVGTRHCNAQSGVRDHSYSRHRRAASLRCGTSSLLKGLKVKSFSTKNM